MYRRLVFFVLGLTLISGSTYASKQEVDAVHKKIVAQFRQEGLQELPAFSAAFEGWKLAARELCGFTEKQLPTNIDLLSTITQTPRMNFLILVKRAQVETQKAFSGSKEITADFCAASIEMLRVKK
jgi:hypothetical protein